MGGGVSIGLNFEPHEQVPWHLGKQSVARIDKEPSVGDYGTRAVDGATAALDAVDASKITRGIELPGNPAGIRGMRTYPSIKTAREDHSRYRGRRC